MYKNSHETKNFNIEDDKEKITVIYDRIFELISTLKLQIKDSEERNKTFNFLQKIIENIVKNKNEEKFRKLKFSNKSLKDFVFCRKIIVDFLYFLGFLELEIDSERCLVLLDLDESLFEITYSYILLSINDDSSK